MTSPFSPMTRKIGVILFITAALALALQAIRGVVAERQSRQQEVESSIAAGIGGRQTVIGPLLIVQVRETLAQSEAAKKAGALPETTVRYLHFVPDALAVTGDIDVKPRARSIYRAQTFRLDGVWRGTISVPPRFGLTASGPNRAQVERAFVAFAVSDPRGLRGRPQLDVGGRELALVAGTSIASLADGFRAEIDPATLAAGATLDFGLTVALEGTGALTIVPGAGDARLALKSNWPHPSFEGAFLPEERSVTAGGFAASWRTTLLATNLGSRLDACLHGAAGACALSGASIRLVEPVNVYLRAERAVKYGLLFIGLTFGAFFVFETIGRARMHPLQYALVGLALALFFLLLISLSEHVDFGLAYLAATVACVGLIASYLRYVLGNWRRGLAFGALLSLLFAVLYGLLLSEDNALVLGSGLLFASLAAVMWLTRHVDWYSVGATGVRQGT